MSWLITGTQKIDPDAAVYLSRVETADGQTLEAGVRTAIESFIVGCKSDGIWSAIKASCILAGARTRLGALTPLVGAAPTSFNFVDGDYNRKTGLVGDGSTKYLNSNRNNNADPQNSNHNAVYVSTAETQGNFGIYIGSAGIANGTNNLGRASSPSTDFLFRNRVSNISPQFLVNKGGIAGFVGMSRSASANYLVRETGANITLTSTSAAPTADAIHVFQRAVSEGTTTARLAFYSIGESLNLALLDARVTDLINAFDTAIPS
jgi:hypothetical protein